MGRPWNPDEELARRLEAQDKRRWPEGATAGLVVIGAACLGIALLLYKVAGPRDVFGP